MLRMVSLVLAAMAMSAGVAAASETPDFQGDAGHSGGVVDPALDGPLQVLWTQRLVKGLSYPLVADGRAFVRSPGPNGSPAGDVVAVDLATGRVLWRRALQPTNDLVYGDGTLYALNQSGLVVALDPATGVTRWANGPAELGISAVYAPPVFYDGIIYYNGLTNDEGSSVVAQDAATGAVLWHAPLSTYDADAGVAADAQGIYLGDECGYGRSWTHGGAVRWTTRTPCSDWSSGFGEQTVLADGRVFTDYRSGAVLDTTSGAVVDAFVRPSDASLPAFGGGHVAVLSNGTLTISDRATLTTTGSYGTDNPDAGELMTQPFFVGDRVFSENNFHHLIGIDAATALPSADVDLNTQVPMAPNDPPVEGSGGIAVGGGVIVVATTDGRLVAVTGPGGPTPVPPVDGPPTTTTPPTTTVPPVPDPPVTTLPPAVPGRPTAPPVRATAAAVHAAARRISFPAGTKLRLVRRGLTLTITGALSGATVEAILRAGGRVVWHAPARRIPKSGRIRLPKATGHRAAAARSAQLELRVRAPHATTVVVRRTLR